MTLVEYIHEKLRDEREMRADIRDHNCYAAGYSDGVLEALEDVKDFYLEIGKHAR